MIFIYIIMKNDFYDYEWYQQEWLIELIEDKTYCKANKKIGWKQNYSEFESMYFLQIF